MGRVGAFELRGQALELCQNRVLGLRVRPRLELVWRKHQERVDLARRKHQEQIVRVQVEQPSCQRRQLQVLIALAQQLCFVVL